MFLDFNKFEEQIPAVEQEEGKMAEHQRNFFRVCKAEKLSDVDDISTEALCFVMLYSDVITKGTESFLTTILNFYEEVIKVERIRTARLL